MYPDVIFILLIFSIFGVLLAAPKYPVAKNANINRAAARCIGSLYRPLAKSFEVSYKYNIQHKIYNCKYQARDCKRRPFADICRRKAVCQYKSVKSDCKGAQEIKPHCFADKAAYFRFAFFVNNHSAEKQYNRYYEP